MKSFIFYLLFFLAVVADVRWGLNEGDGVTANHAIMLLMPYESLLVVLIAFLSASLIIAFVKEFPKLWTYLKTVEFQVKIPGMEVKLTGSGLVILFLGVFVLFVVLYGVLRMIPGAP